MLVVVGRDCSCAGGEDTAKKLGSERGGEKAAPCT